MLRYPHSQAKPTSAGHMRTAILIDSGSGPLHIKFLSGLAAPRCAERLRADRAADDARQLGQQWPGLVAVAAVAR